jgi:hypothetical protein
MKLRRGTLTDHYVEDERSVVMVGESVLGLSPVATAILEAVPDGAVVALHEVTQHVVDTFGPPGGPQSAEDLTRQQVWDLVAHGVLVVVDEGSRDGTRGSRDGTSSLLDQHADEERAAAVAAVRDALRHVRSAADQTWSPPGSVSPSAFVAAARQHHVVPYLASHVDRLDLPGQARAELTATAGRQRAGATLLAADLSIALDALDAAGVRALAVKGIALAAQAYGDFGIRGAGDLDLLVAPEDLAGAHAALDSAGWAPASGYPRPGPSWAWRHFVRTGNELLLTSATSDIDLHWHLVPTRGTFPSFDVLWERRSVVSVDGHDTPTLSPYDALAHSAGHTAKDGWRWLRSLLDVHALAADPHTWVHADRPLRQDQLRSVGLCAQAFGVPSGAPPVVALAADALEMSTLHSVTEEQADTALQHRHAAPGLNFVHRLKVIMFTRGSAGEATRLLSRSLLPPWLTAAEQSASPVPAVPRVLWRRVLELAAKIRQRLSGR